MEYNYTSNRWWKAAEEDRYAAVISTISKIKNRQLYRDDMVIRHFRLYRDVPILGLAVSSYSRVDAGYSTTKRLAFNVVRSVVDTIASELAQSQPVPMFLTEGGSFDQMRKAKKLTKFIEGMFYKTKFRDIVRKTVVDMGVFGTGVVKFFEQDGEVYVERIFPGEMMVDDYDSMYGEPRSIYQTKWIDRGVLREAFPEHKEAIDSCNSTAFDDYAIGKDDIADQIMVVEAWHKPSSKEAGDGRHSICIDGSNLLDEEWDDDFPFCFLRASEDILGFWGVGFAEQLTGIQLEINRLARDIQRAQYLCGTFRIFLERGSKVVPSHMNNEEASIVEYSGTPPVFATPAAVHPELYQQLDRLYQKAYDIVGVSMLAARSEKPAGLNSGASIRAYADEKSKRFMTLMRSYDQFHIDAAEQIIALMKRISKTNKKYEVVYKDKNSIERIKWSEVNLEQDSYAMQVMPSGFLPTTPAGKLAAVQDLMNAGLIDSKETFYRLLDFPDLEAESSLVTAPRDLIQQRIEKILDEGEYYPPEPFMNLQLAMQVAVLSLQKAELTMDIDDERLDMLRQYITDCQALMAPPEQGAPDVMAPPPPETEQPLEGEV